jgi:predicted DNA-binding transcriptional regulator AlpA
MSKEKRLYISTRQLRERYGGVSHMWIERRLNDDPQFPRPAYFGRRRFWSLAAIAAWERLTLCNSGRPSRVERRAVEHNNPAERRHRRR